MGSKFGRIIRLVWNGPFHVGPLASPVSFGDALLKILQTAWRAGVLLALALLLLLTFILGVIAWEDYLKEKIFPPLETAVSAEVRHFSDPDIPVLLKNADGTAHLAMPCMDNYPLSVSFYNASEKPLSRIDFAIRGYVPGRTSNVLVGAQNLEADALILPGHRWQTCYSARAYDQISLDTLVYETDIIRVEEADPELVESAPPPFVVPQPDAEEGSGAETSWAHEVWEFITASVSIILGIVFAGYAAYCISAIASWITRGKISPAQNLSAVLPWAYLVIVPLGVVLLSGFGPPPRWMEWTFQRVLDAGSALGLPPDWVASIAAVLVMSAPILIPIILHILLRVVGANIAPLLPFRRVQGQDKSEVELVGEA